MKCNLLLCLAMSAMIACAVFPAMAFAQSTPVRTIASIPGGRLIAASDEGLHFYNTKNLKRGERVDSEIEKIYSLKVSPKGNRIAFTGGTPGELGVIEIFSLPKFDLLTRISRFDDVVTDLSWMSDDQIAAGSMTGKCSIFDLSQKKTTSFSNTKRVRVHSKGILSLASVADGHIISTSIDTTIRVWRTGQSHEARVLNNHLDVVNAIAVKPQADSNARAMMVSASDDGTVRFWQPTIGRMVRFVRLESIPTCVSWNHDGTLAIAGCRDGVVRVIDPISAKVVRTFQGSGWIHCVAIGKDTETAFVGNEKGISKVDLKVDRESTE